MAGMMAMTGRVRTKSVLLFHFQRVLANAYIKADNGRGEEQCVLVDKGKREPQS